MSTSTNVIYRFYDFSMWLVSILIQQLQEKNKYTPPQVRWQLNFAIILIMNIDNNGLGKTTTTT